MDKLQKIGTLLWNNKERMVLLVMVVVLGYRVYGIIYPESPQMWAPVPPPQTELPQDREERQALGLPSAPPPAPPLVLPGSYASFHERNPFWYYASEGRQTDDQRVRVEDLNIQLLDIQDAGGVPRARIQTQRTRAWYSANEQFEEFELLEIDPDMESVVIYSERYEQPFTLNKR